MRPPRSGWRIAVLAWMLREHFDRQAASPAATRRDSNLRYKMK
jgi:hypothetical protein